MIGIGARHRVRALILATLFSLSYAAISDGKIVEEDLETMVHESKLIVLGKVARRNSLVRYLLMNSRSANGICSRL